MSINNFWRNKQVPNALLKQELVCVDFLNRHSDLSWAWHGPYGRFFEYCEQKFKMTHTDPTGLIIINYPLKVTPGDFVQKINRLLNDNIQAAYLAVNRFQFLTVNDLNIDYADDLTQAIEQIVDRINCPFKRLPNVSADIDGHHFVGVHGLDIFTYERS